MVGRSYAFTPSFVQELLIQGAVLCIGLEVVGQYHRRVSTNPFVAGVRRSDSEVCWRRC
jgi:hypothetical protein